MKREQDLVLRDRGDSTIRETKLLKKMQKEYKLTGWILASRQSPNIEEHKVTVKAH